MNDIPISSRLQKEAFGCLQCGSAWRVRPGLCVCCLLSQGLGTDSHDSETLRTCLLKSLPFFSMKFAPAGSLLDAGPVAPRRTAAKRGADGKDRVPYVLLCRRRALTAQSGRLW